MGRFRLIQHDEDKNTTWYCITCEKRVNMDGRDVGRQSYFIGVRPFNVRICVKCMAETIEEGSC
jgi:hypothetical protein